ncbi:D-alanine--D-alanine ligase [Urechidicola vernalis]|uniref:D-alanine--D-alanine ligase n=1 Tax=Urechidicola vernalis TaxID=3075600 RepID=A0ABU2Y7Y0_9FLAO|nr:D-alanine--D-alanine ligase [Urechidicola sp. P050]MDT0554304.1 D-alanine--D-alanine ligase [Urechidicola sp. P050]
MSGKTFLYKLKHWEYWPSYMFYLPNIPYACYLAVKAKSPVFYSAVNPGIYNSGNGMESKFDTIKMIPERLRPKTVLICEGEPIETVLEKIKQEHLNFPLIAKPDIGFRGLLVKKINSREELEQYLLKYPIKVIIQEFIDLPNECGIFYYRIPDEQKGHITSITFKEFLTVTGTGKKSIEELITEDKRARLYLNLLQELHGNTLHSILKNGEKFILNTIGNHCKGTRFINGNDFISKELEESFDSLNKKIDGWYYGRIDIKYNQFDDLLNGENYKILEINGIISEPTHIYDASTHSYFKAVKSIATHWKTIYKIAKTNHFILHFPYTKTSSFLKDLVNLKRYTKRLHSLTR